MQLALVGLSHKTAPVEIRERLAFSDTDIQEALKSLVEYEGVSEAMILSTCNRVEVVAEAPDDDLVREFLCSYHRIPCDSIANHLYTLKDNDVIRHMFRVASSLDSMVVGEPQILGQVKEAFRVATDAGTVGLHIGSLMERAMTVAKKVRTNTGIAQSAVSVSYAAVELARKIFGDLSGKSVMIIGASKMGELAARHLKRAGVSMVLVTNRTFERAVEMSRVFEGAAIPFEYLNDHIDRADIVISSTGAPHFVITKTNAERIIRRRKNRPMFFIDIAVPRDIDPGVNDIDNVFLYDIDDLQQVVDENMEERMSEATRAEEIVDTEVEAFCSRMRSREVVPTIVQLRETLEKLRRDEIERNRKHLGAMTDQQQEAVDRITRALVNKILHQPIAELKGMTHDTRGPEQIELIRKIFNVKKS
jgi:glutamyl-tRNA reductase